jgi:hypothetical protein
MTKQMSSKKQKSSNPLIKYQTKDRKSRSKKSSEKKNKQRKKSEGLKRRPRYRRLTE